MSTARPMIEGTIQRFWSWWMGELASLVPSLARPLPTAGPHLVLAAGPDGPRLFEERGTRRTELTAAATPAERRSEIEARLAGLAGSKRPRAVIVRLPREVCFTRQLTLPSAARTDAGRILHLDLEQATPFRHRDVLTAHRILPDTPAKDRARNQIAVEQIIVKRSAVTEACRPLDHAGLTPLRVDCWDAAGPDARPLDIDFLADLAAPDPTRYRTPRLLALTGLLLALAAAYLATYRLETAVSGLEGQSAAARARHGALEAENRQAAAELARTAALVALKSREVSRVRILEALTRLLPDTDHLSSLRIDGATLEIAGYSASTAALVPLIERSDAFERVSLTAPVTFDEKSGLERFTLKAEITAESRSAAAGPGTGGG